MPAGVGYGQGLLSNPLLGAGIGLLDASGPSPFPVGIGQALRGGLLGGREASAFGLAQQGAEQSQQLDAARIQEIMDDAKLEQDAIRREEAEREAIRRLLGPAGQAPGGASQQGAPQAAGLLAQQGNGFSMDGGGILSPGNVPPPPTGLLGQQSQLTPQARMLAQLAQITGDAGDMTRAIAARAPAAGVNRQTGKDINGRLRYLDTGEFAFKDVTATPAAAEPPKQTEVSAMRKEFLAQSKDWQAIRNGYERVQAAGDSAAGDMSLVFGFMKVQDPGSTVREGEFASAEQARGVASGILNMYNRLVSGERLTPAQRADFKTQVRALLRPALMQQKAREQHYAGIANRANFDPRNVVTDQIGDTIRALDFDAPIAAPQTASAPSGSALAASQQVALGALSKVASARRGGATIATIASLSDAELKALDLDRLQESEVAAVAAEARRRAAQ